MQPGRRSSEIGRWEVPEEVNPGVFISHPGWCFRCFNPLPFTPYPPLRCWTCSPCVQISGKLTFSSPSSGRRQDRSYILPLTLQLSSNKNCLNLKLNFSHNSEFISLFFVVFYALFYSLLNILFVNLTVWLGRKENTGQCLYTEMSWCFFMPHRCYLILFRMLLM